MTETIRDRNTRDGASKLKLLYLIKIFYEKTDENHFLTMEQLIAQLDGYGIVAERKSLYRDIRLLGDFGIDIIAEKRDRNYFYHVCDRRFELAELKLLVDSVQSARFITEKKSRELIKKLEGLASQYEAEDLQHQVFVTERVKSGNERILYNIDAVHRAIEKNRMIRFRYFNWNEKKQIVARHGGEFYEMSPWALTLAEENYYLVAYDRKNDMLKYFRMDKMQKIEELDTPRAGKEKYRQFDVADYSRKRFNMFDGPEMKVRLKCANSFAGVIIDRFGKDVFIHDQGDGHFEVSVNVAVSRQFYAWVLSMNDDIVITGPEEVLEDVRKFVGDLAGTYIN